MAVVRTYKVELKFAFGGDTWSEVYYRQGDDMTPQVATEMNNAQILKVRQSRGPGVNFVGIKATEVGGTRISWFREIGQVTPAAAGFTTDVSAVAFRLRFDFAGGGRRFTWVRGNSDNATQRTSGGAMEPTSLSDGAMGAYSTVITALYKGQRLRSAAEVGFQWQSLIKAKKSTVNEAWTTITAAAGAIIPAVGTRVYFRFIPRDKLIGLRGQFVILDTGQNNTFDIGYRYKEPVADTFLTRAQVRKVEYDYPGLTYKQIVGLTTHKTGNPAARSRGRSKGLALRQ